MELAVILSVHNNKEVALDTLESITRYATNNILVLVDGSHWGEWENVDLPVYKLKGFNHGWYRAPYRNVLLGLMSAYRLWPNVDWVCYMEYDCLFGSSAFKKDLQDAADRGCWCIGNDFRRNQDQNMRFLETIVKGKFEEVVYLLGACVFYYKEFFKKAFEQELFERFLFYTNEFKRGFFPFYSAWDLTEHALPSIVKHYGGKIEQFAAYNQTSDFWSGNFRRYPVRYRPELEFKEEHFLQASIMHPVKTLGHSIREFHRQKRKSK